MMRWRGFMPATFFLAFCLFAGSFTPIHATSSATVTIRLEGWMLTKTDPDTVNALILQFEKQYKHIKVDYTPVADAFESHLEAEFLSAKAPDVFEVDMGWARDFIQAGVLQRLNVYAGRDKSYHPSNFIPGSITGFSRRGAVYAYPFGFSTLGLWYDKKLFKAAGLKFAPRDWNSFSRIACELTNKKKHVYGAVLSPNADPWFAFLKSFGGRVLNSKASEPRINSKQSATALAWYAGLVKKGCAEQPPSGSSDEQELATGHATMAFLPSSAGPYLRQTVPKLDWGVTPLPTGPKGNSNLAFVSGYAMNAHSKQKEADWKLISFLTSSSAIQATDSKLGYLPARRSVKPPKSLAPFTKGAAYATPWAWPAGLVVNAFPQIALDISQAMTGTQSYQAAVTDMAVWLKRYL